MNNKRRKEIQKAISLIEEANNILKSVLSDEEFSYDNMPENLQASIKGMASEDAIDTLTDVIDMLDTIAY